MEFIGTVNQSQQMAGKFIRVAQIIHKSKLIEVNIDALHIGPASVIGVDPMAHRYPAPEDRAHMANYNALKAERVRTWGKIHAFLLDVLAINKTFSFWVYRSGPVWDMGEFDMGEVMAKLYKSTFYICTPDSINSIGAVQYTGVEGYEVWSPYIRNNLYNGGSEHYRKKSIHKKVALTSVRRYIRPIPTMEKHLPDWDSVTAEQYDAIHARQNVAEKHLGSVYAQRARAAQELVALRRHQRAGKPDAYVFQDGELLAMIDNFIEEDAKLGDAINKAIEDSNCYQRIQIRHAPDSGEVSYQLTHIEVDKKSGSPRDHRVYAKHVGNFRPIAAIPDETAMQISTLDFLGKDFPNKAWNDIAWVLNTGIMMEKGVLYYIPVAPLGLY